MCFRWSSYFGFRSLKRISECKAVGFCNVEVATLDFDHWNFINCNSCTRFSSWSSYFGFRSLKHSEIMYRSSLNVEVATLDFDHWNGCATLMLISLSVEVATLDFPAWQPESLHSGENVSTAGRDYWIIPAPKNVVIEAQSLCRNNREQAGGRICASEQTVWKTIVVMEKEVEVATLDFPACQPESLHSGENTGTAGRDHWIIPAPKKLLLKHNHYAGIIVSRPVEGFVRANKRFETPFDVMEKKVEVATLDFDHWNQSWSSARFVCIVEVATLDFDHWNNYFFQGVFDHLLK